MNWMFKIAPKHFDDYSDAWEAINQSQENHLLLDPLFVRPLIRHFASQNTLLGISQISSTPGLVLLEKVRPSLWQTFQPSQAPLGLILLGHREDVAQQIDELLCSLPGYPMALAVLHQDPAVGLFAGLSQARNRETLDYIDTPRLTVTASWDDYWKGRSKNLVHNLTRQRRRIMEQGLSLQLVVERDPTAVVPALHEYGRLEGSGWKGQEGSAVTANNRQGLFYREVLENFCRRGEGLIYRLVLNGQTIAIDLGLERGGTLVILKTTYDETLKGISPGLLLHQEIFQSLFSEAKVRTVEFYGQVRDWHLKWTSEIRTMYHVNFYRYPSFARLRPILKSLKRYWRNQQV